MKIAFKHLRLGALLMLVALSLTSCVKNKFDEPPANGEDPNITVNTTIAALKARYSTSILQINDEVVISGIVTADDRSGNFYKTIVIQDSTAGISIRLDGTNLYNDYPIGRRIFIKCKGLYLGAYSNLIQLGGYVDVTGTTPSVGPIPSALFDQFILKGKWGLTVTPKIVRITDLNDSYQNMLIKLDNVEFKTADANQNWADPVTLFSVNRTLEDCSGNNIIVRTSGYSNFAGKKTPSLKGSLTAIYTVYGLTPQLVIRDEMDAVMDSTRCGGGGGTSTWVSIADVRAQFTGTTTTASSGKIRGVVISDAANANFDPKNIVIQDSLDGGITVRFTAAHSFNLGDIVEVDVSGQELSEYRSLLEVNNVPLGNATLIGTGGTVIPRVATIADINTNAETWESTLVQIDAVSIGGTGTTYSGTRTLTDATASINMYTRSGASFATMSTPIGTMTSIIGILSQFTTYQINIRNPTTDVIP